MDFVGGALPNVMFIVGMIAIGVALGIEFKIVEVKGQLSKTGRISTFAVGSVLILTSIYLYTRPAHQTAAAPAATPGIPVVTPATVNAALAAPQPPQGAPVVQPAVPAGGAVAVSGVIRQVGLWNNQTAVMIDQITYVLPPDIVASLGSSMRVGTTLTLVGTRAADGTVVVSSAMASSSSGKGHKDKDEDEHED
jgi:hypothetical protein